MKSFYAHVLEDTLQEGKLSSSIKAEMNRMQDWWNKTNAASNGDLLKKGLLPIGEPPFDRLFKGGIVVMGINPGNDPKSDVKRRSIIKSGQAASAYDYETKKWILGGAPAFDTAKGLRGNISDKIFVFDPKRDIKQNVTYVKHARMMLSDLGLKGLSGKVMWTNMIPFPSKNVGKFGKYEQELYKMSVPWVRSFLKLAKPSLLFVPISVFDKLDEYHGMSHDDKSDEIWHKSKSGNYTHRFYQAGIMPDGTPVVGFAHWSSTSVGGPHNANWKGEEGPENLIAMKKDLERMLGVKAPRAK